MPSEFDGFVSRPMLGCRWLSSFGSFDEFLPCKKATPKSLHSRNGPTLGTDFLSDLV